MNESLLTFIGAVVITPLLTLATIWVKNYNAKETRRDARDDKYIKGLEERILALETRLDVKEKEIREIRHELKNRDAEYIALYQEYTTLRAKHEVLQTDHNNLKKEYDLMVSEMDAIKLTIKKDRERTSEIATATAQAVTANP